MPGKSSFPARSPEQDAAPTSMPRSVSRVAFSYLSLLTIVCASTTGLRRSTTQIFESVVLHQTIQPRQGAEHCCLSPVQSRRFVDQPGRIATIIKIAAAVLHILNCPLRDLERERFVPWITIAKEDERIDGLSAALDVKWQGLVIVVFRSAVRKEERILPIFVSIHDLLIERRVAGTFSVVLERVEYISGMKVIHPTQVIHLTVIPGKIRALIFRCISNRPFREG